MPSVSGQDFDIKRGVCEGWKCLQEALHISIRISICKSISGLEGAILSHTDFIHQNPKMRIIGRLLPLSKLTPYGFVLVSWTGTGMKHRCCPTHCSLHRGVFQEWKLWCGQAINTVSHSRDGEVTLRYQVIIAVGKPVWAEWGKCSCLRMLAWEIFIAYVHLSIFIFPGFATSASVQLSAHL
jgi:hypothetical protein